MELKKVLENVTNSRDLERIHVNLRKHNTDKNTGEKCKTEFDSVYDCIAHGFVWDQTPEGFDYWADKAKFYWSLFEKQK